tara:strand:- start:151 stop:393 length:243 start_codon:yes stop_codon:yes gene_type:complete
MVEISKKLDNIDSKIKELEVKLDKIIDLLENNVKPNCEKMNSHIDFIDGVYDTVKNPLHYICDKIVFLKGNNIKTIVNKE